MTASTPLRRICIRPDAQKKIGGLSPVAADVVTIVLNDPEYWTRLGQIIKVCKPLVDAIGNLESRDATLADCMLELIRCSRHMIRITPEPDKDYHFWVHAKTVFNAEFYSMNTNLHALALFLHPLCRKLAISNAAKGRSFEHMCSIALAIAKQ